jgi:hypothetical protein
MKQKMSKGLDRVERKHAAVLSFVLAFAGLAPAAGATATYDVTPVTTSVTSDLAANLPVILGIVGGLIALGIAIRSVRKFAKV